MRQIKGDGIFPILRSGRFPSGGARFIATFAVLGVCLSAFLLSCNVTDRNLGEAPIGPVTATGGLDTTTTGGWVRDSVASNMRIYATPQIIKAGNKARSIVTVQVFDVNHNSLKNRLVRFAASLGTITANDTTDAEGTATATYAGVPRNGEVRILASADVGDSTAIVGTSIQLQGLTVSITPLSPDTLIDQNVPLTISVTDGEGEPVAAAAVKLQGASASEGVTDGAGLFRTSVKSDKEQQVKISASALGAAADVTIGFWTTPPGSRSRTLLIFADPSRMAAAAGETSRIKAILYDDSHNPVAGKRVSFSANLGIITPADTTDENGVVEAVFQGFAQNADAVITASYPQGDSTRKASTTITLAGIQIEVKPLAGEAVLRDTVPVSIRVRDAQGRALPDVQVTLKGGLQSSLRTNASGSATATMTSASEQSIVINASALGATDSAKVVFLKDLPTSSIISKAAVGNLRIFVDQSTLKASNSDETTVRVVAFDKFNNPLAGRPVRFTANQGIITSSDTTNSRGEATATYRAVPINVDARITASMTVEDSSLSVFTTVTLAGLQIDVVPSLTDALLNRTVPVLIKIIDGAGNPVPDATVIFNGNPGQGTTDGEGVFRTAVTSGTQKRVTITAKALGAQDSNYVDFWSVLPTKGENTVGSIRNMRIFSSRSQLRADNSDFSVISVILTNENNNPATGDVVKFTSDLGIIGQTATVDSAGRATVVLRSAPVNGVCKVVATAVGRNLSATTEVLFSGVTLQLAASQTELKVGELANIEAFLKDASGNAIGGDPVEFTLTGPGAFDNGNASYSTVLNPNGKALVRVTASASGKVIAKASALNTSDSLELVFSNNSLSLAVAKASLAVGGGDSTLVTATYVNGSGAPVSGAVISFATNAGIITNASPTTDGTGRATTYLKSAAFSGTATIQANAPAGTAQIHVDFNATAAKSIKLTITADNIGINGGVASLRAEVADAQGNLVSGENVNFRILKGPGGGESITKPVVQTQAGVALSQLQSGSIASSYRGTLVVASVGNLADTSKLTISGTAYLVTVSRPEDDSVPVGGGGIVDETTFEFFQGAVVQDINGNAVADGTEVHFSAVVTGLAVGLRVLDHWDGLGTSNTSVKPIYRTVGRDIPFEDINNNLKLDAGIDLDLDGDPSILRRGEDRNGDGNFDWNPAIHDTWFDFNGNGVCDPGVGENDTAVVAGKTIFADLNADGFRNRSEILVDRGAIGVCDEPASGDYPYSAWEVRDFFPSLQFRDNEFAVAIEVSAVTKNGVAHARLRYPRQLARRLYVNVNAEANGIRDRDGERYLLPQIK
ncbi:MAG: Ig domain protein group 1 domain protein [Fibrobacteres bacterium]|nr:Ig domain protein group 1 domain protein [Fibrobacterota bacterium]